VTGAATLTIPDALEWTGGTLGCTGQLIVSPGASVTIPSGKAAYGSRPIDLTAANAAVNWTGGTLTGVPWHLYGRLYLGGSADKTLLNMALNTYGYTTWTGAGDLVLDDGAVFTSQVGAGFDVQNDRIMLTNRG
jgi:hypothetical protein